MSGRPGADDNLSMFDRLDLILDAIEEEGFLTLSGVISRTGIARSTAHRLLTQMERRQWLFRAGQNYELGPRLFTLGTRGVRNQWFYRRTSSTLHWLHAQTRCVVHLAYLDGTTAVCWDKIGSGTFAEAVPTRIGAHVAAHTSAFGKALLASQPGRLIETIGALSSVTQNSIVTTQDLHSELETVRKQGFAVDNEESFAGVGCFGTTIHPGADGAFTAHRTTAAISVCAPIDRLDSGLIAPLLSAKRQILRNIRVNPMTDS
ncbi:MAG: IclR family transcriptional regulator [Nocardioides sp.]|nr:IclR family transcriptional regulator [Nocardioides sp.]